MSLSPPTILSLDQHQKCALSLNMLVTYKMTKSDLLTVILKAIIHKHICSTVIKDI